MSAINDWLDRTNGARSSVQDIERDLSPQEMELVKYHRDTIAKGQVGRDPQGRPVTVYSNTIETPDGRYATVPGYYDGTITEDPAALLKKWGPEIEAGKWPVYDDPAQADSRAKQIHGIMDLEGDGKPAANPSPLAEWLQSDPEGDRLKLSIQEGAGRDSGRARRILQLQLKTGFPQPFIDEHLDTIEAYAAKQDFNPDLFRRRSRSLAAWIAQHPDHAAAVKEDLTKLSYVERQYRYIGGQYERGNLTTELADLGLKAMTGALSPEERTRAGVLQKALAESDNTDITGFFEQIPGQVANQIPIQLRSLEGKVKAAGEGTAIGAAAGATAGAATGNPALPAVGATLGAITGWRYGAAVEAGKMEAALAYLDYEQLKDEKGQPLDRQTVLGLSGMVGVVNGALEGLTGIERALNKLPGVRNFSRSGIKQLLDSPSARSAVLGYAKTVGAVMLEEGATEGVQSMVTAAGKVLAKATGSPTDILGEIFSAENLSQAVQEARAGAQGGGGLGAVVAVPSLAADLRQAKQAKQTEQAWLAIGQATESTKMREALPEHLQAIIAAATKDGPIETVYMPTDAFNTYFQSKGVDPREAAAAITGNVEAYDQAIQTGQDLPIRTEDYATKIAPTEHNAFFAHELRTAVDAMNAREAEEWQAQVEAEDQAAAAQADPAIAQANDAAAKVRQDIAGQLQAAGFDPTVADQYAALYEARYRARAERRGLGEDPFELFQKLHLTVTKQIPEILKTLGGKTSELDALLNRLRVGDLPKESEVFGQSLTDFLKEKGGLQDQGGELSSRNVDAGRQPFHKNLIQANGLTLDQAAELAAEAGYLENRDLAELLDALDKDSRGKPVYAIGRENASMLDVHHNLEALKNFLADREINLTETSNDQIKAMLGESIQQSLPAAEGQTFAQAAVADMVLVNGVERPANNSTGHAISHSEKALERFWAWFNNSKAVDEQGRPLVLYHGTRRADRIGTKFSKKRATSGPMAFFTDDNTIASKYSTSKQDTSISLEDRPYQTWFKVKPEGSRVEVDIARAWYFLTPEQRNKIAELAPRVGNTDDGEQHILREEGHTSGIGSYDYDIKQHRGNALMALVESWLNSGALFNAEEEFLDVLKLAGFPWKVTYDSPFAEHPAVIPVYLSIQNPLITNAIPAEVIDALETQAKKQKRPRQSVGADPWDKRIRDPREWVAELKKDSAAGKNSFVWTSIPDWVTAVLKAQGYDGIQDTGGKMGGQGHNVWVPFEETQVKSALANRGTFDATKANILYQGDGSPKGSITFGDNLIDIKLLEGADLSTFIHETGHLYLNELIDDATTAGVSEQLRTDLDAVLKWMGLDVRVADGRDKIRAAVQTAQHEQWARGFEAYALEGKAPSQAIREAFARFRQWLIQVYRLFRRGVDAAGQALDVKLSNEVREVMDRMLATDEEIEAAAAEAEVLPLFTDAAQAGMSEAQWANYQALVGKASRTARETLQAKLMGQFTRQQATWWKEARTKMLQAVTEEVNAQPVYTALAVLQTGTLPDGSPLPDGIQPMKLDRKGLADVFGKDFLKRMPRKTTAAKEGMHHETAAQMFGYTSGQDFVMALVNARDKRQLIEAETDRRMQDEYGDLRFDGTLTEAARVAVLNEHQEEVLAAEIRAISKKRREVAPFVKTAVAEVQAQHDAEQAAADAQRTAEARAARYNEQAGKATFWEFVPSLETVRTTAKQQISRATVRTLQPYAYFVASQKASRAAVKALAENDYMAAGVAKHRELLNLALFREATAAIDETERIAEHMRELAKKPAQERLGKAGADYLDQINELLERFEFTKISNLRLDQRQTLAQWIAAKEAAGETMGEEFAVPEAIRNEAKRVNYRELAYEELLGIRDVVKQIEHFAALKNKLLKAQKARDKDAARDALIAAIETNLADKGPPPLTKAGLTRGEKVTKLAQQFDASLLKMEQVIEWLDGGATGPWHDYFWNPAADAQAAEYDATKTITAKIAAAVAGIPKEIRAHMLDTVAIPGIEAVVTRKDLLGVALNVGNQSNYDKLLKGMNWTSDHVEAMLGHLTEEEWQFVQSIWNTLDSLYPEISALQKRLTGLPLEKIPARPVVTRFGTFAGGYYPIMYSSVLSDQGQLQLASNIGGLLDEGYTRATVPSGHRKGRVEGFSRPFDLDVDRLPNHIAGVVKDLTHREWLIDANWIANDPEIRAVLQRRLGDPLTLRMTEWVRQVVNDRNQSSLASLGVWHRMVEHFRYNVMIVAMGFKASTLLSQLSGVAPAIEVIGGKDQDGAKWFAKGVGEVLRRPQSAYDFMVAKSGEMRHRLQTRDRDVRDQLRVLEGKTDALSELKQASMMAIGYVELMVSMPSWFGAYYKALDAGQDEETAVRMGDRAVRLGQGAGGAKDLAAVAAKSDAIMRVLTMFYSPFSALYGRLRNVGHDVNGIGDVPGAAFRLFWVVTVAATLGELAAGHGPDDKNEESWLAWWLKSMAAYPFLAVPMLRDAISAITTGYGYQFSPMAQALKVTADTVKTAEGAIAGDKELGDLAAKTVQAMSYLVGLPTGQLTITGTYLYDLANGTAHPDNLFQFAKGFLYKRTKEERGQ